MPVILVLVCTVVLSLLRPSLPEQSPIVFSKQLTFNIYNFQITTLDTGTSSEVAIQARRGSLLLTAFRLPIDGIVVGADVADLDSNRFPEIYIYLRSTGTGSFGRVVGWQFLPDRRVDILPTEWPMPAVSGYMGHDSLWTESYILCRKFPVYASGDANAYPTGGVQMVRYRLKPAGQVYVLEPEKSDTKKEQGG